MEKLERTYKGLITFKKIMEYCIIATEIESISTYFMQDADFQTELMRIVDEEA